MMNRTMNREKASSLQGRPPDIPQVLLHFLKLGFNYRLFKILRFQLNKKAKELMAQLSECDIRIELVPLQHGRWHIST